MKNHLKAMMAFAFALCLSPSAKATEPAAEPAAEKEWNFLVFLNGVNNLDSYGAMNINQMETVGTNDQVNILVQWGSYGRNSVDRLLVKKDDDTNTVTSPVVQSLGAADMGDWKQLVEFAKWSQKNYPAKKTFIVVWNHGGGWHLMNNIPGIKDISWDDRTGNVITTEQLGVAMKEIATDLGRKVDVYSSDACLMGMVEVADEMADSVDYFVGSQDLEPGEGWPYEHFLKSWMKKPNRSARDVSTILVKEFLKAYNGGVYGRSKVTLSALDMSKLPAYRTAFTQLTNAIKATDQENFEKVKTAAAESKMFFNSDYRDIIDFINKAGTKKFAKEADTALRKAHKELVFINKQNQDRKTFGLSVWIPGDQYSYDQYANRYLGLKFHKNTGWGSVAEMIAR